MRCHLALVSTVFPRCWLNSLEITSVFPLSKMEAPFMRAAGTQLGQWEQFYSLSSTVCSLVNRERSRGRNCAQWHPSDLQSPTWGLWANNKAYIRSIGLPSLQWNRILTFGINSHTAAAWMEPPASALWDHIIPGPFWLWARRKVYEPRNILWVLLTGVVSVLENAHSFSYYSRKTVFKVLF